MRVQFSHFSISSTLRHQQQLPLQQIVPLPHLIIKVDLTAGIVKARYLKRLIYETSITTTPRTILINLQRTLLILCCIFGRIHPIQLSGLSVYLVLPF